MNVSSTLPVSATASAATANPTTKPGVNQETATARRALATAARVVNASEVLGQQNELVFSLDPTSHRIVAQIVDRETKQLVEQVPPEYILKIAQELTGKPPSTVR
jgi:uncharacterized FlaG/YvyC family protein